MLQITKRDPFDVLQRSKKVLILPAKRGQELYNPVRDTYVKNSKLNRLNIQKQIDKFNNTLEHNFYLNYITQLNELPRTRDRGQVGNYIDIKTVNAIGRVFSVITLTNKNNLPLFEFINTQGTIKAISSLLNKRLREKQYKLFINADIDAISPAGDVKNIGMTLTTQTMLTPDSINTFLNELKQLLIDRIDSFQTKGSGWMFQKFNYITLNLSEFDPLRGGSYLPTPEFLVAKKGIINVHNTDNKCFMYSVLSALHPVSDRHPERPNKYIEHIDKYNWTGIEYPTKLNTIKPFEKNNVNISINVYHYENGLLPLKLSDEIKGHHINLLLIINENNQHYTYIKNFSAIIAKENSNHKGKVYPCFRCQQLCTSNEILLKHSEWCSVATKKEDGVVVMPNIGDTLSFETNKTANNKKFMSPFIIYSDFEAILPTTITVSKSISTKQTNTHIPCGFCIYVVSAFEKYSYKPIVYRGENCMDVFYDELDKVSNNIRSILCKEKPMRITREQEQQFHKDVCCHICDKPLLKDRVRDHCHITGLYRGSAHTDCNVNFNYKNFKIPVVFHNLKNYDAHFIISNINKNNIYNKQISVIANNSEKYMTFSIGNLKFIDSVQFLSASLDSLVNNLKSINLDDFKHTKQHMGQEWEIATRKGIYPYEYMNSFEKFEETTLPPMGKFYSALTENSITEDEYKYAQSVWTTMNMKTMGDYHDYYLKSDVLLLADVFETFRKTIHKTHKLDPAHYITLPSFSWDAMLLKTKIELELLTDYEMLCMVEKGIRGGISVISHRYATANNPYLKSYDNTKPHSYIKYDDANNLYGGAMNETLPYKGFKWINNFNINMINSDINKGYIIECDLEYPEHLHDLHNDYPLAPENIIVNDSMLSEWQLKQKQDLKIKSPPVSKLCPNLMNKSKYVLHSENLKYYISKGLILTNTYRVIEFEQKPFLKEYIDMNTELRKKASNDFEKDLYKLLNNSVFGKTMESIRGRTNLELVSNDKRSMHLTKSPLYKNFNIINENLVSIQLCKKQTKFDKPIYIGMSILDLSKLTMYKHHYDYIKPLYGNNATLLFTDTDSLCYEVETDDIYKDMRNDKDRFDTSNYPKEHFLFDKTNAKVVCKFKDETGGTPIKEFIGIRSKCYSFITEDTEKQTLKGVKKSFVKNHINHNNYVNCIRNTDSIQSATFMLFRSQAHIINTYTITKNSLTNYDDKRIVEDGIKTYAFGHHKYKAKSTI